MANFTLKQDTINVDSMRMTITISGEGSYQNQTSLNLDADEMGRMIVFLKKSRAMLLAVHGSKNLPIKEQDQKEVEETKEKVRNIIVENQTQ